MAIKSTDVLYPPRRTEPRVGGPLRDLRRPAEVDAPAAVNEQATADGVWAKARVPRSAAADRASRTVGPEDAGLVGDKVQAAPFFATAEAVLEAKAKFDERVAKDPGVLAELLAAPYPSTQAEQLDWALARPAGLPNLEDPVWTRATNDNRAAVVAFVQGVVSAQAHGISVAFPAENRVSEAEAVVNTRPELIQQLQSAPFPKNGTVEQQFQWAIAIGYTWNWRQNPSLTGDPQALALVGFVQGTQAKHGNLYPPMELQSERRTIEVDGDTRVYAVHTPPGPKPAKGWPTVLFFHGSYGGHAPEQVAEYQQLNALADAKGFQIMYPVGLPQDRADGTTGRGMLNWDPVGAGPGGANDKFVHALLKEVTDKSQSNNADPSRIYAAGHSQGGFYTSDLIAAYPNVFAGAAILGAGLGSVADTDDLSKGRKTPTLLRVGADDVHSAMAERLAGRLDTAGWGKALKYEAPVNRGHEVLPEDLDAVLDFFKGQPAYKASKAGQLTGETGHVRPRQVFRDKLDLDNLPRKLKAQPELVRALNALAATPELNIDFNARTLMVDEWRRALLSLQLFPPAMQKAIEDLRPFFVLRGPPGGKAIDLNNPPPVVQASAEAMAALHELKANPYLDLDGYPGLFTAEEAATAIHFKTPDRPELNKGIDVLRSVFFPVVLPPEPDLRARQQEVLPGGAKIESYPDSDAALARLKKMIEDMSRHPGLAKALSKATMVISPPGKPLAAIPEGRGLPDQYEGVASALAFEGPGGRVVAPPAFLIREDSLRHWTLGAAHELLHLYRYELGDQGKAQLDDAWRKLGGVERPNGNPNSDELFAYFGQWYLAGFKDQVKEASPEMFALLTESLGDASVDPGALTAQQAQGALTSLVAWFRGGP